MKIIFFQVLLLVIGKIEALPIDEEAIDYKEVANEAKEVAYEEHRDEDLQASINGGQSGWALSLTSLGIHPQDIVSPTRPKRQENEQNLILYPCDSD